MSLVPGNLVHETSVTTGTGNQTLVAVDGKRTFNTEHSTGGTDVFDYFISNPDAAEWERGTGHMSSSTVLVRDTVIQSSNGDAAVSFTAGTKNVTNDLPSSEQAGVWDLIETVIADDAATVDIINISSTYYVYKFVWADWTTNVDSRTPNMRTDANNGASFDTGLTDYAWVDHRISMETSPSHFVSGNEDDDEIRLIGAIGSAANEAASMELILYNPSSTEFTMVTFTSYHRAFDGVDFHEVGGGMRLSAAIVNAVRFFLTTSGDISGTLKVYGMRA